MIDYKNNMLIKKKKKCVIIIIISLNLLFDIIAGSTKYTRTVQDILESWNGKITNKCPFRELGNFTNGM